MFIFARFLSDFTRTVSLDSWRRFSSEFPMLATTQETPSRALILVAFRLGRLLARSFARPPVLKQTRGVLRLVRARVCLMRRTAEFTSFARSLCGIISRGSDCEVFRRFSSRSSFEYLSSEFSMRFSSHSHERLRIGAFDQSSNGAISPRTTNVSYCSGSVERPPRVRKLKGSRPVADPPVRSVGGKIARPRDCAE